MAIEVPMVQVYFATDMTKQDNKQLVLAWLENDFKEKHQPTSHFWYNTDVIVDAFDACRGMVVCDDQHQLMAYMVWSFYSDEAGAEIKIVEVSAPYRSQGIFTQMLLAFSNRFPQVAVLSVSTLPQAQPVFEKMGWQRVTRSTTLPASSDFVFFKMLKPISSSNTLPDGIVIAICSEDFYQVKTNPKNYADRTYYLTPTIDHEYNLTQAIVGTCHKDGYLGFYLNQQLIHECKPKQLTDSADYHHAIVVLKQFPMNILKAFLVHAASTKAPSNEEEETTPARKMLRGQDSARIKNQMSSQQTVLFTNPPEEVGDLSADEICQAIAIFCQQDEHYDGQSPLETTEWCRYPLIFFLLESYQHTKYLTVADKSALSASIKMVMDRYPSARNAVFGGKDPFSYCAYHSLCDLLKILQPSAVELANKNIHCTAIEEVLNVLDIQDNQSLDTLQYLLQILGNAISNEFWSLKIKAIFKNKYYSAREEEPKQRQRHIQTMQLMLDWKILSLSQEFISELTETILPEMQTILDQGIWVRGIEDLTGEVDILNKRETLTDEELNSMRHSQEEKNKTNYTQYSPANFVCSYAQYHLYNPNCAGVVIDTGDGPFSYWQDGSGREMLSAHIDFTQETLFNEEDYSYQFSEIEKSKILEHIQLLQSEYLDTHDQSFATNQVIDHHVGITLRVPIIFQPPQWNEGLLRYKKKHIVGFYVYPEQRESVINVAALRQALQLTTLPVFALSEKTGTLIQVDLNQLITAHSIIQELLDEALIPKQHTNLMGGSSTFYHSSSEKEYSSNDVQIFL